MGTKIRFEFETEDFYTEKDLENLKASFGEALSEIEDADVVEAATIHIVTEGEFSDAEKQKLIADFVANATVEYQVQARFKDEDGKIIGSSVSAEGTLD